MVRDMLATRRILTRCGVKSCQIKSLSANEPICDKLMIVMTGAATKNLAALANVVVDLDKSHNTARNINS